MPSGWQRLLSLKIKAYMPGEGLKLKDENSYAIQIPIKQSRQSCNNIKQNRTQREKQEKELNSLWQE